MKRFLVLVCLCLVVVIQSAPTATPYKSGGLGITKASWESRHGEGISNEIGFLTYENGKLWVLFDDSDKVWHIERNWGDDNAVPINDARRESKKLIPSDAKFGKTYTSRSGNTVDLYNSRSLKSRFSASKFTNGRPGDLIIIFRNQTGLTTSFVIGTGNNP